MNIKLVNNSGSTKSYNEFDFKIQTSSGNRLDPGFTTAPNALNSGDLISGGSVAGNIVFEVPKDNQGLKLVYDGSLWSNEVVIKL